jgi:hypothetical protein
MAIASKNDLEFIKSDRPVYAKSRWIPTLFGFGKLPERKTRVNHCHFALTPFLLALEVFA